MLSLKSASIHQLSKIDFRVMVLRVKSSPFIKNIFLIMTGTAIAQGLGFALTPIISRLYSPSDYGIFGSFNAVLAVISAGVTLQYSQAIMLPKEKENAINLFFVSCLSTIFMSLVCLAGYFAVASYLKSLMKTKETLTISLLGIATVAVGLSQSLQAWAVRVKEFKQTSASQIIRSLSSNGTQLGFGFLNGGGKALIISSVLGELISSINVAYVIIRDLPNFRHSIKWNRIKQLAKDYKDFPLYSASQNVINALSSGLPVLILTYFFGINVAGAYAFGMRILVAPMGLVLGALRQVLFQKAGETQHQGGSLGSLYVKTTFGLFAIAFFPSLILFIWGPQFFVWLFGNQWHTAGEFARSLVIWMIFGFCNLPAVLFARLIRIQRTIFLYDLVLLVARTLILMFGGIYLNPSSTVMLFSIVGAAMNSILILMVGHAVIKKEGRVNWESIRDCLMKG